MKFSKQRELILNEILNNPVHPTADYLYENLKKDNPNLSLGTRLLYTTTRKLDQR
ncbi:transcriptional repressor [Clostridioides difficile]|uniref:transcriptional repressor n=1 Tax=Clostridioides difficile TaxID=1496 RepID=UPI001EEF365C